MAEDSSIETQDYISFGGSGGESSTATDDNGSWRNNQQYSRGGNHRRPQRGFGSNRGGGRRGYFRGPRPYSGRGWTPQQGPLTTNDGPDQFFQSPPPDHFPGFHPRGGRGGSFRGRGASAGDDDISLYCFRAVENPWAKLEEAAARLKAGNSNPAPPPFSGDHLLEQQQQQSAQSAA